MWITLIIFSMIVVWVIILLLGLSSCWCRQSKQSDDNAFLLRAHFVYGLWDPVDKMSNLYKKNMKLWQTQGWQVTLWTPKEIDKLLERYPQWQELYLNQTVRRVQKADIVRYLIVYDQGGFYFDLDCTPDKHNNLFQFLQHHHKNNNDNTHPTMYYFVEHVMPKSYTKTTAARYPIRKGKNELPTRIANYAFGCQTRFHKSLIDIFDLICNRLQQQVDKLHLDDYGVLYTTGPDVVTEVVHFYNKSWYKDMYVFDQHSNFLRHSCTGTWRNQKDQKDE